ncbi:hypothetical protein PGT21_050226 [Puccinia graminis f. sp. tritici]|uniref:HAT C-terminal dimerisation domain-containing protein n=1 Tax=Puccinia graminis f. sp. tritici TaxID=56615 RepID=A0A5B0SL69_PUCGR|nr:hypothetical protein PGT21_050226 [Puccinia graminis f. sp. tritici]KAA1138672.1 hypothetical protein PGTUg99_050184 [Puccinia graminis f. sp. tritici]
MIAKIKDYFDLAVKKPVYLCSTLLDPQIKTNILTGSLLNDINMSIEEVIQMLNDAAEGFSTDSFYTETQASKKKGSTEDDSHRSTISSALFIKKKMKILSLQEEITVYLDSECEEEACDPLAYWKCNSKRFPSLSRMAQTYLAASASSTPCERAFSVGRHVQDYSQNRMKAKTLESIICLQNWIDNNVINICNSANISTD